MVHKLKQKPKQSEIILKYKKSFGTDELKKMAKSGFGSKVIVTPLVDKVAKDKRADVISIYITDPTPKPELLGYVTAKATGNNVVSMDILAEAALAARELGGKVKVLKDLFSLSDGELDWLIPVRISIMMRLPVA